LNSIRFNQYLTIYSEVKISPSEWFPKKKSGIDSRFLFGPLPCIPGD